MAKKAKPKKERRELPALARRDGEPISPEKLRRAMKDSGKKGPKKKRDLKFRGVKQ